MFCEKMYNWVLKANQFLRGKQLQLGTVAKLFVLPMWNYFGNPIEWTTSCLFGFLSIITMLECLFRFENDTVLYHCDQRKKFDWLVGIRLRLLLFGFNIQRLVSFFSRSCWNAFVQHLSLASRCSATLRFRTVPIAIGTEWWRFGLRS